MSDVDASTPRVFLARHGETEWTKNGRYTGSTDLELTPHGVKQVKGTASQLVGSGKLIDPARIVRVWVSPRKRALQTFGLLFNGLNDSGGNSPTIPEDKITITEDIAEWDYGDYEGLLVEEIRSSRKERGLDQDIAWNIWRDGCEGGESAQQATERLDRLISDIRKIQESRMHGEKAADVVLTTHYL
ncbi:hypothetical protein TWF281_001516 [Arthrobotrys megalospora]